jgi:hypothetical protein
MKACENVKAYLACTILIGASLEYLLSSWIRAYSGVVYASGKKLTDRWDLKDLNELAYRSGFMNRAAYLASERIRKFRNMVHPNWYAGRKPTRFSKALLDERISDFNLVVDSLERNL